MEQRVLPHPVAAEGDVLGMALIGGVQAEDDEAVLIAVGGDLEVLQAALLPEDRLEKGHGHEIRYEGVDPGVLRRGVLAGRQQDEMGIVEHVADTRRGPRIDAADDVSYASPIIALYGDKGPGRRVVGIQQIELQRAHGPLGPRSKEAVDAPPQIAYLSQVALSLPNQIPLRTIPNERRVLVG